MNSDHHHHHHHLFVCSVLARDSSSNNKGALYWVSHWLTTLSHGAFNHHQVYFRQKSIVTITTLQNKTKKYIKLLLRNIQKPADTHAYAHTQISNLNDGTVSIRAWQKHAMFTMMTTNSVVKVGDSVTNSCRNAVPWSLERGSQSQFSIFLVLYALRS